jgi:2-amino-4-hydroxy-6-hydroxymethyldihydropteridine diphosphokinase
VPDRTPAPAGRIFVSLGCNVGDCDRRFDEALAALAAHPRVAVVAASTRRITAPVGGVAQADFTNAVVELVTDLDPDELLALLHRIEADGGRDRTREVRWGPRTLDLDLLLHGDAVQEGPPQLPHPRLLERRFLMELLAEIAPDLVVPGQRETVAALLTPKGGSS